MKNRKRIVSILAGILAGIMILTLILSILPVARAASSSEIRRQINSLQEDRKEIKNKLSELEQQVQTNTDEIADIISKKNVIDQEIGLLHEDIRNINEQISAYSVLIADKQDELNAAEARFQALNDACKTRIQAMEEEGTLSYWEVLFKANSFSDLLDRLNMVEEITASDNRRLAELTEAAQQVANVQAELMEEKAQLEATRQELNATQETLNQKRDQADDLLNQLLAKARELAIAEETLEQQDEEILAEIARKEKEYNEAKNREWLEYMATATTAPPPTSAPVVSVAGGSSGGTTSGTTSSGTTSGNTTSAGNSTTITVGSSWLVPCSYIELSSPFGFREAPTSGASTYHQGVDLRAPAGTPIVASRGGTVTTATFSNSAGYYVTINHGDGFSSIYMHMTNYVVSAGQQVSQGQLIGYVGQTGVATGNHLHFGIMINGAYVNPCSYVGLY